LRKVVGEFATEFFVEVFGNDSRLALPLELGGRSDSASDRMTGREHPASVCVVLGEGRIDKLAATAAT
jgi:hypothetical protein